MRPIKARSRRPTGVVTSMLSSKRARLRRIEHGRLAALHAVRRPAHGRGRIHRDDLARHQPVEQMTDRGEALLDGRRGSFAAKLLDVGRDVQRLHVGDRGDAGALAPGQKFPRRLGVGAARVLVADVGGEEFEEAQRGVVAGGGDEGWNWQRRGSGTSWFMVSSAGRKQRRCQANARSASTLHRGTSAATIATCKTRKATVARTSIRAWVARRPRDCALSAMAAFSSLASVTPDHKIRPAPRLTIRGKARPNAIASD